MMKRDRKVSLFWFIVILLLLVASLPIVAVGVSALLSITNERSNSTSALLERQAADIYKNQGDVENILKNLAVDTHVINFLVQMDRDPQNIDPVQYNTIQADIDQYDFLPGQHTVDFVTTKQLVFTTEAGGQTGKRYTPETIQNWISQSNQQGGIGPLYIGKTADSFRSIPGVVVTTIILIKSDLNEDDTLLPVGFIAINYSFSLILDGRSKPTTGSNGVIPNQGPPSQQFLMDSQLAGGASDGTFLIDDDNQVLYDNLKIASYLVSFEQLRPNAEEKDTLYWRKINNQSYSLGYYPVIDPPMSLYHISPSSKFSNLLLPYENITLRIFAISLLWVLLVAVVVGFSLASPIHRVTNSFKLIQMGMFDWNTRIRHSWLAEIDEMVVLLNTFIDNQMIQRQTEQKLIQSEQRYRSMFENSPVALQEQDFSEVIKAVESLDTAGRTLDEYLKEHPDLVFELMQKIRVLDVNRAAIKLLHGHSKDEVLRGIPDLFMKLDVDEVRQQIEVIMERPLNTEHMMNYVTLKGKKIVVLLEWRVFPGAEKMMNRVMVSEVDITEQFKRNRLQTALLQISQDANTVETMDLLYRSVHESLKSLMPARNCYIALYDSNTQMITFPFFVDEYDQMPPARKFGHGWTEIVINSGKPILISEDMVQTIRDEDANNMGTTPVCWLGVPLIVEEKTMGVLVVQSYDHDTSYTTEDRDLLMIVANQIAMAIYKKQAEEHLIFASTHDELTGLYNRAYYETEISRLSARRDEPVGVIMVDIDGLKYVNDRYGHVTGDELIRASAEILKSAFRVNDVVARIGGDEFAVLLPESTTTVVLQGIERTHSLLEKYNASHTELPIKIGFSIGGCATNEKINLADAVQLADRQMYRDKEYRKNLEDGQYLR
jgi:diguanylate cyclase (GGDEF)-like protein